MQKIVLNAAKHKLNLLPNRTELVFFSVTFVLVTEKSHKFNFRPYICPQSAQMLSSKLVSAQVTFGEVTIRL